MLIAKELTKITTLLEATVSSIPLGSHFARMFSSNAAKQLASVALRAGKNCSKRYCNESYRYG